MNHATEAQARITINKLLEEAGWRIHSDANGPPANIQCEHRVTRAAIAQDLGFATGISTRSHLASEEFERFLATQTIIPIHVREMRTVFTAFLLAPDCRAMLMEGRFAELRARDASRYGSLPQLSVVERDTLLGYMQSQVSLKQFELAA